MAAQLRVTARDGSARTITLQDQPLTIGRAPDSDLAFPEDGVLSRRHAVVAPEDTGWVIEDLGSRNGTWLNGARLEGRRRLRPGDRVDAGGVSVVFEGEHALEFVGEAQPASSTDTSLSWSDLSGKNEDLEAIFNDSMRIQMLLEAGRELAGHRPLNDLFPLILTLAMRSVGAARGALLTLEDGKLTAKATSGGLWQISQSVRDKVLATKESILVRDMSGDMTLGRAESIVAARVRSLMAVPLDVGGRVIGLIYVDSPDVVRPFSREDLGMLTVMANIAAARIEHARLLTVEQAERLLARDLEQAAEIQRSLLPRAAPVVEGYEFASLSAPCRFVGGDFFDYGVVAGGRTGVMIGDVAGKGLPAALLMSGLMARVQVLAEVAYDVADLVERLNRSFAPSCPKNRFITLFLAAIDAATGNVSYCNAGHNPPYLRRADGRLEMLTVGGPVVGAMSGLRYDAGSARLDPGDSLVMFSDGVTEAEADGVEFGDERLEGCLKAGGTAGEMLGRIEREVEEFLGGAAAGDDLTLVVVRRVGLA